MEAVIIKPDQVMAADPTQRLKMTYEEFLAFASESQRMEWVNGEVIIHMPPLVRHQKLVHFLSLLLGLFTDFFKRGTVLTGPIEMKALPDGSAREPDILFVATENLTRLTPHRLVGPADLVVEIVSDDSVSRDRTDKFYEYQDAGVREYWLIDPRPHRQREDFWTLDEDGRYQPIMIGKDRIFRSTLLPDFWLRLDWLHQDPLPEALKAFAEIVGLQNVIQALGASFEDDGRP